MNETNSVFFVAAMYEGVMYHDCLDSQEQVDKWVQDRLEGVIGARPKFYVAKGELLRTTLSLDTVVTFRGDVEAEDESYVLGDFIFGQFQTVDTTWQKYNGKPFELLAVINEPVEGKLDIQSCPMFTIRFEDGATTDAWADEIFTPESIPMRKK